MFQLIITPVRGANKAATEVADCVAVEMECQAHHDKDRRSPTRYPVSMLSKMRGGGSLYPLSPSPGDRDKRNSECCCQEKLYLNVHTS
jgi:hypothetical protein